MAGLCSFCASDPYAYENFDDLFAGSADYGYDDEYVGVSNSFFEDGEADSYDHWRGFDVYSEE